MCGRYLLRNQPEWATHTPWREYWEEIDTFSPRFNIAPSQKSPVLIWHEGAPKMVAMQWGFRPTWAKSSFTKINSRGETLFSSKMFQASARRYRCLIPADGFYEPKGDSSQPHRPWYLFEFEKQRAFNMAGIWTIFDDGNEYYQNFSIITTSANELMAPIHDRMPVILDESNWMEWLSNDKQSVLESMLVSREYEGLQAIAVGDAAKNPRNEGPQCIEPSKGENLTLF